MFLFDLFLILDSSSLVDVALLVLYLDVCVCIVFVQIVCGRKGPCLCLIDVPSLNLGFVLCLIYVRKFYNILAMNFSQCVILKITSLFDSLGLLCALRFSIWFFFFFSEGFIIWC